MSKAIGFVVRDSAGGVVRGSIAADGGSNFIQLGRADEVSLNLGRQSLAAYGRKGDDLALTLVDGREIVLGGYFHADGTSPQLYLSQSGEIVAVHLSLGRDGAIYAAYGATEGWDKYSALDSLRFAAGDDLMLAGTYNDDPAGMALFAPGLMGLGGAGAGLLGLGLAGAVIGGGGDDDGAGTGSGSTPPGGGGDGGGGGGSTPPGGGGDGGGGGGSTPPGGGGDGDGSGNQNGGRRPPKVNSQSETKIIIDTLDKELHVSGSGEPGDRVLINIGGQQQSTIIRSDATWSVTFPKTNLPADGNYRAEVEFSHTDGSFTTLPGPSFLIDLTPPEVQITGGAKSTGDVENAVDYLANDGITITGKGEPGATLVVTVEGHSKTTVVAQNGTWSVTYSEAQILAGEYETAITIVATDVNGNKTRITDTLVVDTVPHEISVNPVTSHNLVNFAENAAGFEISGLAAGQYVAGTVLTLALQAEGYSYNASAVVGADGRWSLLIAKNQLPSGEYQASVTVSAVDGAGNSSTQSHNFRVDTQGHVAFDRKVTGDDIISGQEKAAVTLTGTSEPGTTDVSVYWNGEERRATIDSQTGKWSVVFTDIQGSDRLLNTTATVTAKDAWGNVSSDIHKIGVDLATSVSFDAVQSLDNVISHADRAAGVTLTGRGEPGASLLVSFENGTVGNVVVGANGAWSATFAAALIGDGNGRTATATVTARDLAGNSASATKELLIDTLLSPLTIAAPNTGTDDTINLQESKNFVAVTGTVETHAKSISVSLDGKAVPAAYVSFNPNAGTWSVQLPEAYFANIDRTTMQLHVRAEDRYGNSASQTRDLVVDTIVKDFTRLGGKIAGDGVLNEAEAAAGITLTGTLEPHSTLVISISGGASKTVSVGANGLWSAHFAAAELPSGKNSARVTLKATDRAGNTETITEDFTYDTDAPDALRVTFMGKSLTQENILESIRLGAGAEEVSLYRVDKTGASVAVEYEKYGKNLDFEDGHGVPDGSYLVVKNADLAGNSSATLYITDNRTSVHVELTREGLQEFDFGLIDLTSAPSASLTITPQTLAALTGLDQTLTIIGDAEDRVTLSGATQAQVQDKAGYVIYELGAGRVIVEDDITIL